MTPESKLASDLPEPQGTGRVMDMNTLVVECPIYEVVHQQCMAWAYDDGEPCQYYNGLCRLPHPETGRENTGRYTVGVDCLYDVAKAVEKEKAVSGMLTAFRA